MGNAIDGLVQDINEFALRRVIRIETINLCIGVLSSGSRRRADPSVCPDDRDMIGDRIAVRRTKETGQGTWSSATLLLLQLDIPIAGVH